MFLEILAWLIIVVYVSLVLFIVFGRKIALAWMVNLENRGHDGFMRLVEKRKELRERLEGKTDGL